MRNKKQNTSKKYRNATRNAVRKQPRLRHARLGLSAEARVALQQRALVTLGGQRAATVASHGLGYSRLRARRDVDVAARDQSEECAKSSTK
jgi:hypothetical protein